MSFFAQDAADQVNADMWAAMVYRRAAVSSNTCPGRATVILPSSSATVDDHVAEAFGVQRRIATLSRTRSVRGRLVNPVLQLLFRQQANKVFLIAGDDDMVSGAHRARRSSHRRSVFGWRVV
ncbi:MAG: hypothetical protein SF097_01540 [Acidobacteriota bacterium]|nr:hypothetical protein [Acidobacteriota bacterium]